MSFVAYNSMAATPPLASLISSTTTYRNHTTDTVSLGHYCYVACCWRTRLKTPSVDHYNHSVLLPPKSHSAEGGNTVLQQSADQLATHAATPVIAVYTTGGACRAPGSAVVVMCLDAIDYVARALAVIGRHAYARLDGGAILDGDAVAAGHGTQSSSGGCLIQAVRTMAIWASRTSHAYKSSAH